MISDNEELKSKVAQRESSSNKILLLTYIVVYKSNRVPPASPILKTYRKIRKTAISIYIYSVCVKLSA